MLLDHSEQIHHLLCQPVFPTACPHLIVFPPVQDSKSSPSEKQQPLVLGVFGSVDFWFGLVFLRLGSLFLREFTFTSSDHSHYTCTFIHKYSISFFQLGILSDFMCHLVRKRCQVLHFPWLNIL